MSFDLVKASGGGRLCRAQSKLLLRLSYPQVRRSEVVEGSRAPNRRTPSIVGMETRRLKRIREGPPYTSKKGGCNVEVPKPQTPSLTSKALNPKPYTLNPRIWF